MALAVKNLPASAGDARDTGLILELGRSPGGADGLTDRTETDLKNEFTVTKVGGCREEHTQRVTSIPAQQRSSGTPTASMLAPQPDAALPGVEPSPPG